MNVTILIPTYNRRDYLVHALDSVRHQTTDNWQILVCDDGSTDGTLDMLRDYRDMHGLDGRLRIIQTLHHGQGFARMVLADECKTEWSCWLDSDDLMHPQRLELQCHSVIRHDLSIVFSEAIFFQDAHPNDKPRFVHSPDLSKWKVRDPDSLNGNMATGTAFFNSRARRLIPRVAINHGGWDILWSMALLNEQERADRFFMGVIQVPLYYIRQHANRITVKKKSPEWQEARRAERVLFNQELERLGIRVQQ